MNSRQPLIKRPYHLIEDLLLQAFWYGSCAATPQRREIKKYVETGADLPSHLKPGALILALPAEQRAMLQTVTARDFNHRLDSILYFPCK